MLLQLFRLSVNMRKLGSVCASFSSENVQQLFEMRKKLYIFYNSHKIKAVKVIFAVGTSLIDYMIHSKGTHIHRFIDAICLLR
jgi:ABC-type spermidine/putrescine transport system permease subunit II